MSSGKILACYKSKFKDILSIHGNSSETLFDLEIRC